MIYYGAGVKSCIAQQNRNVWDTRRDHQDSPVATILRYTEYPSPDSLTETTIVNSGLNIDWNILGLSVVLAEGVLTQSYTVTGYTTTSITVLGATFLADGFTVACTVHIEAQGHVKKPSPTRVQVLTVGTEALVNRAIAWYNLKTNELRDFGNELDVNDRRFIFFDIQVQNDDEIIFEGQTYPIYRVRWNSEYSKSIVWAKAVLK